MTLDIQIGDAFELIKNIPNNSVDLIITSPPYSDIVSYGKEVSVKKSNEYVDWILPLFNEIWRVLKPSGSFILNINDKTEGGYRSTYIYELIYRNNKETKLKLYDTYIWYKKNGIPNGAPKRFRNNTEFIFHFCKDKSKLKFYMDRVLEEPKESTNQRYKYDMTDRQGKVVDGQRVKKKVVKRKRSRYIQKENGETERIGYYEPIPDLDRHPEKVRPTNVFRFPTAAAARDNDIKHPAPYHKELPLYFIDLLTDIGDLVIDPFSGIGTTGIACKELDRNYIGFELNESYAEFSKKRLIGKTEDWVLNQYDLENNLLNTTKIKKNNEAN